MSDIPYDCSWHDDHIEVFQMVDTTKYSNGIYTIISPQVCNLCGNPNVLDSNVCHEFYLHEKLAQIDSVFQIGYYYSAAVRQFMKQNDILTEHILKLKILKNKIYAKPLGKALYLLIKSRLEPLLSADMIVPVPNHIDDPNRDVKAVALAEELAAQFNSDNKNIEIQHAIRKVINISTHGLSRDQKEIVVENGMFEFDDKKSIKDKKIILVDDVLTNGIIKGKCASILRENGAQKIWGLVAGRNFTVPIF